MSRQTFTAIQRQAISMAHGSKCAYSGNTLDLRNMQIDHILPESLLDTPALLAAEKIRLGLPDNFNVLGFENLLPCTQAANLQKLANVFSDAQIHFFIGIASGKKAIIEKHIDSLQKQLEKASATISLLKLLEANKITPEEISVILMKYDNKPDELFRLIENFRFFNNDELSAIRQSDIERMRKQPIKLGLNDHIDGVELYKEGSDKLFVKTCEAYDDAILKGYYAKTTFDIKMATFFEHQCGLLSALKKASLPTVSFVSDPKVGITDLHLLPYSMYPKLDCCDDSRDSTVTFQDMVDAGKLVVKRTKHNLLVVEEPGLSGYQLIEVARADFDGDGIEDILLYSYHYAIGGTMGFGFTEIITRKSYDGLFGPVIS